jgi:hypothetical protein
MVGSSGTAGAPTSGAMDHEAAGEPWCIFGEFDSRATAEVIRGLLEAESVDCAIDPARLELGIPAKFRLSVPRSKLHRARWIIGQSDLSERELEFVATGTWQDEE